LDPLHRAIFRAAALLHPNGLYVSNATISLGRGLGAATGEIPGPAQTKSRFNFKGLSPTIRAVAGRAEMLHKNAEPATNEQNFGH
jgi:hypothetical protein